MTLETIYQIAIAVAALVGWFARHKGLFGPKQPVDPLAPLAPTPATPTSPLLEFLKNLAARLDAIEANTKKA